MKLRIRGDSIRLRLKRGEVDQIASGASIVEETHFPNAVLTFRLDVTESEDVSASFNDGSLVISLPKSKVLDWAGTDEVSLAAEQKLAGDGSLSLLIEKDFSCLEPGHHRDCEDDADTFPHPRADTFCTHVQRPAAPDPAITSFFYVVQKATATRIEFPGYPHANHVKNQKSPKRRLGTAGYGNRRAVGLRNKKGAIGRDCGRKTDNCSGFLVYLASSINSDRPGINLGFPGP